MKLHLACDQAQRKIGCHYLSVNYSEFEQSVLTYCRGLDPAEVLPRREETESHVRALQDQLSVIQAKLETITKRINNWEDAIGDDDDKRFSDSLKIKIKAALDQRESLEKESVRLKRELEMTFQATEGTREHLESLARFFEAMESLNGHERIDLRLRVRQELRRLCSG